MQIKKQIGSYAHSGFKNGCASIQHTVGRLVDVFVGSELYANARIGSLVRRCKGSSLVGSALRYKLAVGTRPQVPMHRSRLVSVHFGSSFTRRHNHSLRVTAEIHADALCNSVK